MNCTLRFFNDGGKQLVTTLTLESFNSCKFWIKILKLNKSHQGKAKGIRVYQLNHNVIVTLIKNK